MHAHPVLEVDLADLAHTRAAAHALAPLLIAGDLLLLSGELGAGKTTFTRALGEGLGVREGIISPTFVLSRVHPNLLDGTRPGGPDLVHVDAYRLSSAEELDDLDLEFSLEKSVTVIEWGRGKAEHLSDSRLELDFTRLTGADASIAYAAENYSPTGEGEFNWDALDDREEESADASEPRLLRITVYGSRWEGEAYRSLETAMLKLDVE